MGAIVAHGNGRIRRAHTPPLTVVRRSVRSVLLGEGFDQPVARVQYGHVGGRDRYSTDWERFRCSLSNSSDPNVPCSLPDVTLRSSVRSEVVVDLLTYRLLFLLLPASCADAAGGDLLQAALLKPLLLTWRFLCP
jgi:hypothetical protein